MFSRVHIICFAASYAIALALELSRLLFRSGIRGVVMLGFVVAGWVAQTSFLYYSAANSTGSPLSSYRDWCLLGAWVLVVVYFYLAWYHPRMHFGVFLLPLVLGLIAVAVVLFPNPVPLAREPASKVWGAVHGISLLLATVAVLVGFAAGVMYLGQARRLKNKRTAIGSLRLPSLEWLQQANSRALVVSLLMLAVGVSSGIVLNAINLRHGEPVLPWNDPVVLGTLGLFGWLALHAVIGVFYRPLRQGRKVAWLTVASFVFLIVALGVGRMIQTQHGAARPAAGGSSTRSGVGP